MPANDINLENGLGQKVYWPHMQMTFAPEPVVVLVVVVHVEVVAASPSVKIENLFDAI